MLGVDREPRLLVVVWFRDDDSESGASRAWRTGLSRMARSAIDLDDAREISTQSHHIRSVNFDIAKPIQI